MFARVQRCSSLCSSSFLSPLFTRNLLLVGSVHLASCLDYLYTFHPSVDLFISPQLLYKRIPVSRHLCSFCHPAAHWSATYIYIIYPPSHGCAFCKPPARWLRSALLCLDTALLRHPSQGRPKPLPSKQMPLRRQCTLSAAPLGHARFAERTCIADARTGQLACVHMPPPHHSPPQTLQMSSLST